VSLTTQDNSETNEGFQMPDVDEYGDDSDNSDLSSDCDEDNMEKFLTPDGETIMKTKQLAKMSIYAWDTTTLEPITLNPRLNQVLYNQPLGELLNMLFIGSNNECLIQILKMHGHSTAGGEIGFKASKSKVTKWLEYVILDSQTGEKLFVFTNDVHDQKGDLSVMGFLAFGLKTERSVFTPKM
jgi:hypothetical protein